MGWSFNIKQKQHQTHDRHHDVRSWGVKEGEGGEEKEREKEEKKKAASSKSVFRVCKLRTSDLLANPPG